jgi:exonuclease SbcC
MRITSLSMQNFRCFRELTTLDLAADVVAIYGRNGSGKTTVFDAIEFALLGEIGRFAGEPRTVSYLPNVSESALPTVRVGYNDGLDPIEASLQPDCTIRLSRWSNHRDLLYEWLVRDEYQPARREIDAIRGLFRATVLLSQWSIRNYIDASPEGRSSVLAHIAGVPYLQRCLEKARDVQKLAERQESQVRVKLQEAAAEIQQLAAELSGAEQRSKAARDRIGGKLVSIEDLKRACNASRLTIPELLSGNDHPQQIATAVAALCREAITDLDGKDRALTELEITIRGHQKRVEQQKQLLEQRTKFEATAAELEKRQSDLNQIILSTQSKMRATGSMLENLTGRLAALDELSRLQAQVGSQRELISSFASRERGLQSNIRVAKTQLENLSSGIQRAKSNRLDLEQFHGLALSSLEKLRELEQSLPTYVSDTQKLHGCDLRQAELEPELKALRERKVRLQQTSDSSKSGLADAQRRYDELDSAQQRKNSLVASLREYTTGNECPLCGVTHQTHQALLNAIDKQLQTAPRAILVLAQQIEIARVEVQRLESDMQIVDESIASCERNMATVAAERSLLQSRIASQDRVANNSGLRMEAGEIERAIATQLATHKDDVRKLEEADTELNRLTQERGQVELTVSQYEGTLALEIQKIAAAQAALTRFEQRAADLGLKDAINWNAQGLAERRAQATKDQEEIRAQKTNEEDTLRKFTQDRDLARDARARVISDLDELMIKLERIIEAIGRTNRLCEQLEIKTLEPEEAVSALRKDLSDSREKLNTAATVAERYRWSAELGAIEEQERILLKQHQELVNHRKARELEGSRLGQAGLIAERWSARLQKEVTEVVERRIRTHQPEILRLFKAMVPHPYLFEEVSMRRSDTGVHLGLKYRDQLRAPAEPKLFLSEGQANVLALAVFLSFACSQEWSRLQTIFLDDPVQHLDDLDAVSFLDNLRAVALQQRKQVIVSTCDQNLYLLMIRKFRVTGKEGLRFRGISLLENGGNSPDVIYDVGGPSPRAAVA